MAEYRAVHGIEYEEDNSVSCEEPETPVYGESYNSTYMRLFKVVTDRRHQLTEIPLGLFRHLPGVEGAYEERGFDNRVAYKRIWLIKQFDNVSTKR